MNKKEVRAYYKQKRSQLNNKDIKQLSSSIFSLFQLNFISTNKIVHTFFSIESQREIDMDLINNYLFQNTLKVTTSITQFSPLKLIHSVITKDSDFYLDQYNIPVPKQIIPIDVKTIDIVLVPLLTFDKEGNRIGYGKGLYDSFLKDCRANCLKIGLSLFEANSKKLPTEPHDIKLDYCITPNKVYTF